MHVLNLRYFPYQNKYVLFAIDTIFSILAYIADDSVKANIY